MRRLPWLALAISLTFASTAEARLFWQTYGATVPTADGGCVWNVNQDYFVPRYCTSGRYGLFSACKSSCTTSPACYDASHPLYPGYCGAYCPWHYHRRDHIYACRCGCVPLRLGEHHGRQSCHHCPRGCGHHCGNGCISPLLDSCSLGFCPDGQEYHPSAGLLNIEPGHLDVLGSIPVEAGELLTRTDFSQLRNEQGGPSAPLQPETLRQLENVPSLGLPIDEGKFINPPLHSPRP